MPTGTILAVTPVTVFVPTDSHGVGGSARVMPLPLAEFALHAGTLVSIVVVFTNRHAGIDELTASSLASNSFGAQLQPILLNLDLLFWYCQKYLHTFNLQFALQGENQGSTVPRVSRWHRTTSTARLQCRWVDRWWMLGRVGGWVGGRVGGWVG